MCITRSSTLIFSALISLVCVGAFAADANPASSVSMCSAPNVDSSSAISDFEGGMKVTEIQMKGDGELEIFGRISEMTSFRVSEKEALRALTKCQKTLEKFAALNNKAPQRESSIKDNSMLAVN